MQNPNKSQWRNLHYHSWLRKKLWYICIRQRIDVYANTTYFIVEALNIFLSPLTTQLPSELYYLAALTQGFLQGSVLGRTVFTYTGTVSQAPWPHAKWPAVVHRNQSWLQSGSVVRHCAYKCMSRAVINKRAWIVHGEGHCESHLYLLPCPYPTRNLYTFCNEDIRIFMW